MYTKKKLNTAKQLYFGAVERNLNEIKRQENYLVWQRDRGLELR